MKILILHIGYPKTASTTLQESVFLKLHEEGMINFLGRTVTSTHRRRSVKKFNQDWVVDIRKHFIQKVPLPKRDYLLSDTLVNVLSDEELTMPAFLNHVNFGIDFDPLEYTDVLKTILKDADEVRILLSIRNQASLIPSLFIQKYRFIFKYFPKRSFEEFIFSSPGIIKKDIYNTFDFFNVAKIYQRTFNAEIIPLIFEDLNGDIKQYSHQISNVVGVSSDLIINQLKSNHYRNRKAGNSIKSVSVLIPNTFGKFVEMVFGKDRAKYFFTFRWYLKSSFLYNLEKKIFLKRIYIESPVISNQSKAEIKAAFSDTNLNFCKSFGLDFEKLKAYNYF